MEIKNYYRAKTIEDAHQVLNQNTNNILIAGGTWLKMSSQKVDTMVDLSDLSLDQITENKDELKIGSMVTLRDIETHQGVKNLGDGFLSDAIGYIMGVGFRNIATIGGSIIGKYPFSDLLTPLLTLDVKLVFFPQKEMELNDYINSKGRMQDILTHIIIKKETGKGFFKKVANTSLDFSILNIAVYAQNNKFSIVVGSRPGVATLAQEAIFYINSQQQYTEKVIMHTVDLVVDNLRFGTNEAADAVYRKELAKAYVKRGLKEVIAHES